MYYYIKENDLCVYSATSIEAINDWIAKHQKTIVAIINTVYHEIIIEVK